MPFVMPEWTTLAVSAPMLVIAYIVFGIAGFGAALVAAPVLAHVMPVAAVVPLLALLDFAAAATGGAQLNNKIDRKELLVIVPLMVLGSIGGVTLLVILPHNVSMLALGLFVVGYAIYSLWVPPRARHISRIWVILLGPIGGAWSALFGAGGPFYAIYLSGRLFDPEVFRATQFSLIALATVTRAILFLIAGLYSDLYVVTLAVLLLPAMALGTYIAHRVTIGLSRAQFLRLVYGVLILTGGSLIFRAVGVTAS